MIRHVSWLLLGLSLLFNVFFLAGYLQARTRPAETEPAHPETVARELDLDETQEAVLTGCRTSLGEEAPVYHNALALVREDFRQELIQEVPDPGRLASLIEKEAEIRKQWHMATAERLFQFVGSLRPEQREHFVHVISRSPRHAARMERMLKRFDRDDDGTLDDAEVAEADEFLEQKRREMDGRRQRMRQRFDADGDGTLSPEEQAAMRQFMMERRGGPGGPGGSGGPGGPNGRKPR